MIPNCEWKTEPLLIKALFPPIRNSTVFPFVSTPRESVHSAIEICFKSRPGGPAKTAAQMLPHLRTNEATFHKGIRDESAQGGVFAGDCSQSPHRAEAEHPVRLTALTELPCSVSSVISVTLSFSQHGCSCRLMSSLLLSRCCWYVWQCCFLAVV